jgi:hypothetical protein
MALVHVSHAIKLEVEIFLKMLASLTKRNQTGQSSAFVNWKVRQKVRRSCATAKPVAHITPISFRLYHVPAHCDTHLS